MTQRQKKILVGPALFNWSETQRMLVLSEALQRRGWKVFLLGSGPYEHLLKDAGFSRVTIPCDDWWFSEGRIRKMMDMKRYGGQIGTFAELRQVAQAEAKLMRSIEPDAAMTGYRMTFTASARMAEIPLIWVMSAVMSDAYLLRLDEKTQSRLEELQRAPDREESRGVLEDNFTCSRLVRQFKKTIQAWNHVLQDSGSQLLTSDAELYQGDLTLMADPPEFFPEVTEEENWRFIGPIFNDEPYDMPELDPEKSHVLVTLGSSCSKDLLLVLLEAASRIPREFHVTAGGMLSEDEKKRYPRHIHFYEKLPLYAFAKHCDLAVTHGGQGTLYNVMRAGCPVVAFPQAFEQRHNIENLLEHYACGDVLYTARLTPETAMEKMQGVLANSRCRMEAKRAAEVLNRYEAPEKRAPETAALIIEEFLEKYERSRHGECG